MQANLHNSPARLTNLLQYLTEAQQDRKRLCDVICVQDPPAAIAFRNCAPYRVHYIANREPQEDDNPQFHHESNPRQPHANNNPQQNGSNNNSQQIGNNNPQQIGSNNNPQQDGGIAKPPQDPIKFAHICFLVLNTIPLEDWSVKAYENDNHELMATLSLQTSSGAVDIHNVYNWRDSIDLDLLLETCAGPGRNLMVGDFNLHHELWTSNATKKPSAKAKKLAAGITAARMTCLTPRGVTTWSRSAEAGTSDRSTIDLAFASPCLVDRFCKREILDVAGFHTDHRVIQTTWTLEVYRELTPRRSWRKVDEEEFEQAVQENLTPIRFPPLETKAEMDDYAARILQAYQAAVETCVPLAKTTSVPRRSSSDELKKLQRRREEAWVAYREDPSEARWADYETAEVLERWQARRDFRQTVEQRTQTLHGAYKWSRSAARWTKPRGLPHMPDLEVDGQVFTEGPDKAHCFIDSVWPLHS